MVWTHVILEAFCMRKISTKKHKYVYELIDKTLKTRKFLNPDYDPNYRTPNKPSYCPSTPQYICLEKGCPHFVYTDGEREDYDWLNKRYRTKNSSDGTGDLKNTSQISEKEFP